MRAPVAGTVIARDLSSFCRTYLEVGDEVAAIGDERKKEIRISVSHDELESFNLRCGDGVRVVDVPDHSNWDGQLERVTPRAAIHPVHTALSAINGGPLPIKSPSGGPNQTQEQRHVLLEPRFNGIVRLNDSTSRQIYAGQCGTVFLSALAGVDR